MTTPASPPLLTIEEVLGEFRKIPKKHFRANKYKCHREAWCVATTLKHLSLNKFLVRTNSTQADSTDITVINGNTGSHKHKIQVVEIAPKSSKAFNVFDGALVHGYSNLKDEVFELVVSTVTEKEKKYSDKDKQKLNLLIYLNPPVKEAKGSTWCVFLDMELDLDKRKIMKALKQSKFGSIILLAGDETTFLKNSKFV